MNRAHILRRLVETFVTSVVHDHGGTYSEFFVNPDRKELYSLGGGAIRFIIDTHAKKLFVFDAYAMTHDWAAKYLHIKIDETNHIRGVALYDHGILRTKDVDIGYGALETLVKNDYSWTRYYYSDFEDYRRERILTLPNAQKYL